MSVQQILDSTKGGKVDALNQLDTTDVCALLAVCGSKASLARHLHASRSWLSEYLATRGIDYHCDAHVAALERYPELRVVDSDEESAVDEASTIEHYRREYQQLKRKIERLSQAYAVIKDIIAVQVDQLPRVSPGRERAPRTGVDEELCELHLSDIHVGELVRAEETAGLNIYDWDVFMQRRERLMERVDSIINGHIRKAYPVNHCFVLMYGDNVTGESIFKGQSFQIDQLLLEQIIRGSYQVADLVRFLASIFRTVRVYGVPGNHGRLPETTLNADVLFYMFMRQYLRDQENVKMHISESSPFLAYFIDPTIGILDWSKGGRRHNLLMAHGNQVRAHLSIPYYGLDRLYGRLNRLFRIVWDRITCGHFHTEGRSADWLLVPSWTGATSYSVGRLQVASRPAQLLNGFHPRQGMTWQYTIWLDDRPELAEPVDGSNIYTPHDYFVPEGENDNDA